jgi:hypothetical protein
MTLFFARWPMDVKADVADRHLTCPHCADDWESFDGPDRTIIGRTGPQRRCPACGLWIDWPEATNAV